MLLEVISVKIEEIINSYNTDRLSREQVLFTSIFIMQNRIQNVSEKAQKELSMKQWLLLTIISVCPKPHTLSNIGRMMGCSRQNVKKLTDTLKDKGYVIIEYGPNNSVCVELTSKLNEYSKEVGEKQVNLLNTLFSDFSDKDIELFFNMFIKLYNGIGLIEKKGGIDNE